MKLIAVYTTVATLQDAQRMAKAVVERRLAACAQISAIDSFYLWDGAVRHEPEHRLMFKTTADGYAPVESAIRELHTYELPAIYTVPVEQAAAAYAAWVAEGSRGESAR